MTSSDWGTLQLVMAGLDDAGLDWAMLHGAAAFGTGAPTDLDIAIDLSDTSRSKRFLDCLNRRGLYALCHWPYDLSGSGLFLASPDLRSGAHLDLLDDPEGGSRYGIRTGEILARSRIINGVRCADPIDEWVYLLTKRLVKAQTDRVSELVGAKPDDVDVRIGQLLRRDRAIAVRASVRGERSAMRNPSGWRIANLGRLARRTLSPIGRWFHVSGPGSREVAEDLHTRLGMVLAQSRLSHLAPSDIPGRLGLHPSRLRATATVTFGAQPLGDRADRIEDLSHWLRSSERIDRSFVDWCRRIK